MTAITDRDREIANTIYEQLGGRRFNVMTGAKQFVTIERGFAFKLPKNKSGGNVCAIRLTPDDLYRIEICRATIKSHTVRCSQDGVGCEQLQEAFTRLTGLHTRI